MKGKALHVILEESNADSKAVSEYFTYKRQLRPGSSALPAPVCTKGSIQALVSRLSSAVEIKLKNVVPLVVICLDEFASNEQNKRVWAKFVEEVTNLLAKCLDYLSTNKDSNSLRVLKRFCGLIVKLCLQSMPVSTSIFNRCAKSLLSAVFREGIGRDVLSTVLDALSVSSEKSDPSQIAATFTHLDAHLRFLSMIVHKLPVEDQTIVYAILRRSLKSIEDANLKVLLWFPKHLKLQNAFLDGYCKSFSQGSGLFVNMLYEIAQRKIRGITEGVLTSSLESASYEMSGLASTNQNRQHNEVHTGMGSWQLLNPFCTGPTLQKSIPKTQCLDQKSHACGGLGNHIGSQSGNMFKSAGNEEKNLKPQLLSEREMICGLYKKNKLKYGSFCKNIWGSRSIKEHSIRKSEEEVCKFSEKNVPRTADSGVTNQNQECSNMNKGTPLSSSKLPLDLPGRCVVLQENSSTKATALPSRVRDASWKNSSNRLSLSLRKHLLEAPEDAMDFQVTQKTNTVGSLALKTKKSQKRLLDIAGSKTAKDNGISDQGQFICDVNEPQGFERDCVLPEKVPIKTDMDSTSFTEKGEREKILDADFPKDTEKNYEKVKNWLKNSVGVNYDSVKQDNYTKSGGFPLLAHDAKREAGNTPCKLSMKGEKRPFANDHCSNIKLSYSRLDGPKAIDTHHIGKKIKLEKSDPAPIYKCEVLSGQKIRAEPFERERLQAHEMLRKSSASSKGTEKKVDLVDLGEGHQEKSIMSCQPSKTAPKDNVFRKPNHISLSRMKKATEEVPFKSKANDGFAVSTLLSKKNKTLQCHKNPETPSTLKYHSFTEKENLKHPSYNLIEKRIIGEEGTDSERCLLPSNFNIRSTAEQKVSKNKTLQSKAFSSRSLKHTVASGQITGEPLLKSISDGLPGNSFDYNCIAHTVTNQPPKGHWGNKVQELQKDEKKQNKHKSEDIYCIEYSSADEIEVLHISKRKRNTKHGKTSAVSRKFSAPSAGKRDAQEIFEKRSDVVKCRSSKPICTNSEVSNKEFHSEEQCVPKSMRHSKTKLKETSFLKHESEVDQVFNRLLLSTKSETRAQSQNLDLHPPEKFKICPKTTNKNASDMPELSGVKHPCVYSPILDESFPSITTKVSKADLDSGIGEMNLLSDDMKSMSSNFEKQPPDYAAIQKWASVSDSGLEQPCSAAVATKTCMAAEEVQKPAGSKCPTPFVDYKLPLASNIRNCLKNGAALSRAASEAAPQLQEQLKSIRDLADQITLAVDSCEKTCTTNFETLRGVENELQEGMCLLGPEEDPTFKPLLPMPPQTYDEQYLKEIIDSYRNPKKSLGK